MKILLVDDESIARQELRRLLSEFREEDVILEVATIKEAQSILLVHSIDVIFLDIHLQNESGLELMEVVNQMFQPPKVIFATADDGYGVKAFELQAQDYLLKPFSAKRVRQVMERIDDSKSQTAPSQARVSVLPVHLDDRIKLIPLTDIYYLEAEEGAIRVQLASEHYIIRDTLKHLLERLPDKDFMQIHRATIVRLDKIQEIEPWFNRTLKLTLANNDSVFVSRTYLSSFREKLNLL